MLVFCCVYAAEDGILSNVRTNKIVKEVKERNHDDYQHIITEFDILG